MQVSDVQALATQVLWTSFVISMVFGALAQRTHFCTMGALSDAVNMGDYSRLRQWALAVAVAVLGFAALVFAEQIDPSKTLYASSRFQWLSALVGGLMFGFGMVLASGCGSKTLVRVGTGNLKSVIVFFIMGVAAYATLRGITAVARSNTVDLVFIDFPAGASLGHLLASASGLPVRIAFTVAALLVALVLLTWVFKDREFWTSDNLLAGFGVGAVVVAMWAGSGVLGHVAEHPETLEETFLTTGSSRIEALTFTAPMAYALDWLMLFSDKNKMLSWSVVSVGGVISGSTLMALIRKEFRWEGFRDTTDTANHIIGAMLMGVGGVTALGCTVGQGLSGISTLSLSSFVAVAAIIAGAKIAFTFQMWQLDRSD
ncbi:MAG: YeeE/YedE family protein [Betaproteobacteria bacterium]|jgi:uncharacterized membrane protein YedE/YeeE|nr:YeeE/YedE family protein [Betaproteobacteria bacterium]